MQLFHLAYISRSAIEGTDQVIEGELESILEAASRNNPQRGITGALLYTGSHFCQVLEGTETAVRDLFDIICHDTRHDDIHTLFLEEVPERQFPNWSMAYVGIEFKQRFEIVGVKHDHNAIVAKKLGKEMVESLLGIVAQQDGANVDGIAGRRF